MRIVNTNSVTALDSVTCRQLPAYKFGESLKPNETSIPAFMVLSLLSKTMYEHSYALMLSGQLNYQEIVDNNKYLFSEYDHGATIKGIVLSKGSKNGVFMARSGVNKNNNAMTLV